MSFMQPAFLSENDHPSCRIRCPIHGFIRYSENERQVIDHPLFRRLRYVKQLALTELIYPGATHTRFEHSLGVMYIATRVFDTLASKNGDLMEATFKEVAEFKKKPMARARQLLRLAALLHDIGHASFSHAAEKVVNKGVGHEDLGVLIIRKPSLLGDLLDKLYGEGSSEIVAQIIEGKTLAPQLGIMHDVISGEMDADRTDYLLRDSYHCGVDYGRFDYRRMIECLELAKGKGNMPLLEIAINGDGIHTFEALILARYQMNTQVYYHRLRRIYDRYLIEYHRALGKEMPDTPEKVIRNNDVTMMAQILRDAQHGQGDRKKWASRIADRNHHVLVFETGVNAEILDIQRTKDVHKALAERYSQYEILIDGDGEEDEVGIHKQLRRTDESPIGLHALKVIKRAGSPQPIGYESQIISKIPHRFRCVRLYADLPRSDDKLRKQVVKAASDEWLKRG